MLKNWVHSNPTLLTGMVSINGLVITADTGAITTGSWTATVISPVYGGTGKANNVASTLTITGAYATTLTVTGTTGVTLPTTGTLATLAGTEELDNKTLDSSVLKGTFTASGTVAIPAVTLGGTVTLGGQVFDAGAGNLQINTTGGVFFGVTVQKTADGIYGAYITLDHVSANPAADDKLGAIHVSGKDDEANSVSYAILEFRAEDVSAASYAGKMAIRQYRKTDTAFNECLTLSSLGGLAVDADIGTADDPVALFDDYDDALVLRQGVQQKNQEILVGMGVFSKKDSGSGYMMNVQPMARLLAGGIYQNRARIDDLVGVLVAEFPHVAERLEKRNLITIGG